MNAKRAPQAPLRRVLLAGARDTGSVHGVRAALRQAWGDGRAVLVTSGSPGVAERYAALLWRRWGGQVERADRSWSLHHSPGSARTRRWDTPARQRPPAPDLSIQLDSVGGARLAEHDRTQTALSDARQAMRRHRAAHHEDPEQRDGQAHAPATEPDQRHAGDEAGELSW